MYANVCTYVCMKSMYILIIHFNRWWSLTQQIDTKSFSVGEERVDRKGNLPPRKFSTESDLGLGRAQTRARPGLGFGLGPQAWLFYLCSKSPRPILLKKHPGLHKDRAQSVKPKLGPSLYLIQARLQPYESYFKCFSSFCFLAVASASKISN
jgi:hypothetical protein